MAKNISKKQLKKPDQFISFWTKLSADVSRLMQTQGRAVAIGAAALAVVVVATVAFAQVRERRAERDSEALARVDRIAAAELLPADGSTSVKDEGIPRFKTEKERLEGALKEVDAFLAASPHSNLRPEGLLHRASYLMALQRTDEAIAAYNQLLGGGLEAPMSYLAQEGLGYAYEAKGDLDKAAAAFARLQDMAGKNSSTTGGFYQDRALYHKARIAEIKGNRADAAKLYHEVLDKAPATSLRDEISNRLAVLESK